MSSEVIRASHIHHAPHIGLPHSAPVHNEIKVNSAPVGAIALAIIADKRVLKINPKCRVARHDHIQEHGHDGGRNVDENDAVKLALLRIDRRDKKTDVQADCKQDRGRDCEPRNHLSGQPVKGGRGGIFEPVYRQIVTPLKFATPERSPTG